jgi:hypothetical protein
VEGFCELFTNKPSTAKSTKHAHKQIKTFHSQEHQAHTQIDDIHIQPHTKEILNESKSAEDIIVTAQISAYGHLRVVE